MIFCHVLSDPRFLIKRIKFILSSYKYQKSKKNGRITKISYARWRCNQLNGTTCSSKIITKVDKY